MTLFQSWVKFSFMDKKKALDRIGKSPEELKAVFSSLDNFKYKDKWYVIDISGNNIRLMAFIEFRAGKMFVKHVVNHPDYDKLCERYAKGEL